MARQMRDELVERRRDFHRHPELAFQEVRTAGIVAHTLRELGLEVSTGIGKTGVVALLEGNGDGPTVLVRADMDALPVLEQNAADYVSQTDGKMHACGHDGHTSILLGVARMLSAHKNRLNGNVKFVFQPAEEIARGAQAMIDDGALSNPTPHVALGLHLWNELPVGTVSITDGSAMAGAADWEVTLRGKGSHGALPEQGRDPVVAGAHIVTAIQSIASRNVSALDTAVVTTAMFQAGAARNVIPSEVYLAGTYRTYRPETRDMVDRRLRDVVVGIAAAMGCEADISTTELTPPLINDLATNRRLREVFNGLDSGLTFVNTARTMAAEDMAVFLRSVPGSFIFVGSANSARGLDFPHHHPRFDVDEDALPIGAGLLAAAIADYVMER